MVSKTHTSDFLDTTRVSSLEVFKNRTIDLFQQSMNLSAAVFYLVDETNNAVEHTLRNLQHWSHTDYTAEYWRFDPLHPRRFIDSGVKIIRIDDVISRPKLNNSSYFLEFMRPRNMYHELELFLRDGEVMVAGLSLIRNQDRPPFTPSDMIIAESIRKYTEYLVNSVYLPQKINTEYKLSHGYGLSRRESEIVRYLQLGATNKLIADDLHISVATVKCHLHRIFNKLDVTSRTELLAQLNLPST